LNDSVKYIIFSFLIICNWFNKVVLAILGNQLILVMESVLCLIVSTVKLKGFWFLNYVWVSEFSLVVLHNQYNACFLPLLCLLWVTCAVSLLFCIQKFWFFNNLSLALWICMCAWIWDVGRCQKLEGEGKKLDSEGLKKLSVFTVCLDKLIYKHF